MSRYEKGSTPKLTENLIEQIATYIRRGSYVETAVECVGISKQTFYRWRREAHDEKASPLLRRLSDAVERAMAESEIRDLAVIEGVANGQAAEYLMVPMLDRTGTPLLNTEGTPMLTAFLDRNGKPVKLRSEIPPNWQAAAWRLERRFPKRWGRMEREDEPTEVHERVRSAEEIEARVRHLKRIKQVLDAVPEESDLDEIV